MSSISAALNTAYKELRDICSLVKEVATDRLVLTIAGIAAAVFAGTALLWVYVTPKFAIITLVAGSLMAANHMMVEENGRGCGGSDWD